MFVTPRALLLSFIQIAINTTAEYALLLLRARRACAYCRRVGAARSSSASPRAMPTARARAARHMLILSYAVISLTCRTEQENMSSFI